MLPAAVSVQSVSDQPDNLPFPTDSTVIPAGTQMPEGQPQPPSQAVSPLVFLAIQHAMETLGQGEGLEPFLLATTADDQKGMWRFPGADTDHVTAQLAQLDPKPNLAVSVFDGQMPTDDGLHDALIITAWDAAEPHSAQVVQLYTAQDGAEGTPVGTPMVYANGENVLGAAS